MRKRAIAYVDGYNFYYGRLRGTPHKWLDLSALLSHVLSIQDPESDLVEVWFYTSMIKEALARLGKASVHAQQRYHRALQVTGVHVCLGEFRLDKGSAPLYIEHQRPDRDHRVNVWDLSEKRTDVNLALGAYRDAIRGRCDQIILVTNDSDFSPALSAIREDCPHVSLGVVLPRAPACDARRSGALERLADWTRHHVLDEELASHQLPKRVPTRKRPIDKPDHW